MGHASMMISVGVCTNIEHVDTENISPNIYIDRSDCSCVGLLLGE